jgi:hypothetical protein
LPAAKRRPKLLVQPPDFSNALLRINVHVLSSPSSAPEKFRRFPMKTALSDILAPETGSYVARRRKALQRCAACTVEYSTIAHIFS